MKRILKLVKEKWLILALLALGAVLLVVKAASIKKEEAISPRPKEILPKPISQFGPSLTTQSQYQIAFDKTAFASLPKQLPVYPLKKLTEKEVLSLRSPVITGLGFLGKPVKRTVKDQTHLVWEEKNHLLDLVVETGQFRFSGAKYLEWPNSFNLASFPLQLKEILTQWKLLSLETTPEWRQSFVISNQQLVVETNPDLATVFQVVFPTMIDGYPLIGLGPTQNLIEAKVDRQGNLLSLNFAIGEKGEGEKNYPLKNYEAVTEEIKMGNLYLFQVQDQSGQSRSFPPISQINQINLTDVALAYLIIPERQVFLQPVFVFSGTISEKNQIFLAKFYLPAI